MHFICRLVHNFECTYNNLKHFAETCIISSSVYKVTFSKYLTSEYFKHAQLKIMCNVTACHQPLAY